MIQQKYEDMKNQLEKNAEEARKKKGKGQRDDETNIRSSRSRRNSSMRPGETAEEFIIRQRDRRPPMTSEQIFMSSKFQKFEKKLMNEYLNTLGDV